jgi:ribosomal protein S18 acetylase RimI-like enzyme
VIQYVQFAELSDAQLDQVCEIYEEAFPVRQRDNFSDLAERAREHDVIMVVAVAQEAAVAFAAFSRLTQPAWIFLEYFAVDRARRGQRIGEALWNAVTQVLGQDGATTRIVFEVEDPKDAPVNSKERRQRERRIGFWKRLGARILPVDNYIVPNIDGSGVESMLLLAATPGHPEFRADNVDLDDLVVALLTEGYDLPLAHPLVRAAGKRKEDP